MKKLKRKKQQNKETKICSYCGKEFLTYINRKNRGVYCSLKCYHNDMRGKERVSKEDKKIKIKEQNRRYYIKHKSEIYKKQREYNISHPEIKKRATKKYYHGHKEQEKERKNNPEYKKKFKIYSKKYRVENKDKIKNISKDYRKRPEIKKRLREYNRIYQNKPERKEWAKKYKSIQEVQDRYNGLNRKYRHTPEGRAKARFYNQRRRINKLGIIEGYTREDFLKLAKKTKGICPSCKKPFTKGFHSKNELTIDHNPPISKSPKGFLYKINNISPLCRSCNSKKGNKI